MSTTNRLNGVIAALENGRHAFMSFSRADREEAALLGASDLDGVLFEMEHSPWDPQGLRDALQYMLNRRLIVEAGSLAPGVTPFVRVPSNGGEMNQWLAKQALDCGVYGVIFPHVSTVEQTLSAVTACRYPSPSDALLHHPAGQRGDGPHAAVRYWGLSQQDYYRRADVWPLNPEGEILAVLMIEDVAGVENLADILKVKGVGAVMIGEGDLSQELGYPRQYEHPVVREAKAEILARSKEAGIPVAHPHVTSSNVAEVIEAGYRILFTTPSRSFATLEKGRSLGEASRAT